jgi:hypothetical protein
MLNRTLVRNENSTETVVWEEPFLGEGLLADKKLIGFINKDAGRPWVFWNRVQFFNEKDELDEVNKVVSSYNTLGEAEEAARTTCFF